MKARGDRSMVAEAPAVSMRRCLGALASASAMVIACGGGTGRSASRAIPSSCPDISKPDAIAALDLVRDYGLAQPTADTIKAALSTAVELGALNEKIDADLGLACTELASDLGSTGDWRSGNDACAAALAALRGARAKAGASVKFDLVVREPVCSVDPSLMTKCASLCDAAAPAEKARAECTEKAGRCEGSCTGSCNLSNSAKCDGVCAGACEGTVKGACSGRCVGTCDGKRSSGTCAGVCAGTCDRVVRGECKGTCAGTCKLAKPSACPGRCSGTCSVEWIEPKCSGDFESPRISEQCVTRCELAVINHRQCSAAAAGVVVTGAARREDGDVVAVAVGKSFPALLEILYSLGERGLGEVKRGHAVVESGVRALHDPAVNAALSKCVSGALESASAESHSLEVGIEQARALRDEAAK